MREFTPERKHPKTDITFNPLKGAQVLTPRLYAEYLINI